MPSAPCQDLLATRTHRIPASTKKTDDQPGCKLTIIQKHTTSHWFSKQEHVAPTSKMVSSGTQLVPKWCVWGGQQLICGSKRLKQYPNEAVVEDETKDSSSHSLVSSIGLLHGLKNNALHFGTWIPVEVVLQGRGPTLHHRQACHQHQERHQAQSHLGSHLMSTNSRNKECGGSGSALQKIEESRSRHNIEAHGSCSYMTSASADTPEKCCNFC